MAETVEKRVIDSVVAALSGISVTGGYYETIPAGCVHLMTGDVMQITPIPACIVLHQGTETKNKGPNNLQTCFLSLAVWAAIDLAVGWQVAVQRFASDIAKALRVDWTRGQLAIDTVIKGMDVSNASDGFKVAVAQVDVQIHFRHLYDDPTAPA